MSTNFTVELETRDELGSSGTRKLRRTGKVPVVVYGAGKDVSHFTTDHESLMHSLDTEAFHSAIIDLQLSGKKEQVILREVQMHPYRQQVLHVDFLRIKATEAINIRVPLHYIGDDTAPGVKDYGGIFSRLILDVEIQCLPKDLPEFLEVDVSQLQMNETVHLSDVKLPEGVALATDIQEGDDHAIASVVPPRVVTDVEEEVGEDEEVFEGEEQESESGSE